MPSQLRGIARLAFVLIGTVLASSVKAQVIDTSGQTIHTFTSPGDVQNTGLTVGSSQSGDVWIYGMRDGDGDFGAGTIFRIQVTGVDFETIHHFGNSAEPDAGSHPTGPLVEGTSGIFYGTTTNGGLNGGGTLFRLDTTVTPAVVTTLHSFVSGGAPDGSPFGGVLVASESTPGLTVLFGTAGNPGLIYRIETDGTAAGTTSQVVCFTRGMNQHCSFGDGTTDDPGSEPQGLIEGRDGLLYGSLRVGPNTDASHGVVFRMQKDGTAFEVLAAAPGLIVGPPVELATPADRWIYVATDVGPGTFPGDAPDGSIFRVLADGSFSERVHTFDTTMLDLGGPPVGRLVGMRDQGGVYGLTSHSADACNSGFGCGSVFRAVGPNPYPVVVFPNTENSRTPQGTPAVLPDGRLVVMTTGQFNVTTIHVVNHPATDPLRVSGSATVQSTIQAFGTATYAFDAIHRNGSTRPLTGVQVRVDRSSALLLASQSAGSGWSCVQADPAFPQYTCTWSGTLNPGDTTPTHTMSYLASPFGSFATTCATIPTPCVTFRADLLSAGSVLAFDTVTTAVTVIHPNTGQPNTAPIANDDSVTVIGMDPVNIRVLDNDYSNPTENDFLSIEFITQPSRGYASAGGNLTIDYVPNAPLTTPDTFQYRLIDTFGASDVATVTLSPPQSFTLSKAYIDIGNVRQGEFATARLSVIGPANAGGPVTFEPVPTAEIADLFQQYGSTHDPQAAVFDPAAFGPVWLEWNTTSEAWIHYRPLTSQAPGRVSVVRVVFRDALPTGTVVGSVVLVGESADPVTGQQHAIDDSAQTAVDTPVTINATANDVSPSGQPLYAGLASPCTNYIEVILDGAACDAVGGIISPGLGAGPGDITYTPPAGFTGTVTFPYASGELPSCWDNRPSCRQETTMYWARITVDASGIAPPNLVATKSIVHQFALVSALEAVNGDTVVFRIGAINLPSQGGSSAGPTTSPITMTDTLPAGLAFVPTQSDARCSASGQVVTCTSALVLNQGDAVEFDITATVTANPAPGNAVALYNEAVAATGTEITTADNISPSVQVLVRGPVSSDLALSLSVGAASVQVGQPITATATITNLGPNAASAVTFSGFAALTGFDQLAIAPAANCPVPTPGAPLVCTIPFLNVNTPVTVTITGSPRVAAPSVSASASVSALEPDPSTINNSAAASFAVTPAVIPPNLRATKFLVDASEVPVSSLTVAEGDILMFRIGAANAATAGATTGPITISDTLPAGLTSPVPIGSGCTVSGQHVTCVSHTVMQPGALTAFNIQATAGPAPVGGSVTVQNVATVTTPDDSDASDDVSAPVSLTILGARRADVSVALSALPSPVLVDQVLTLRAVITNGGPNDAELIRFRGFASVLQPGFRDVAFSTTSGVCGIAESGGSIDCNVQSLAPGASATITVTAVPTATLFGGTPDAQVTVNVDAGVAPNAADVEPANNQVVVPVAVRRPTADLAASLVLSRTTVPIGEPMTATVTVVNNGPEPATQVSVIGLATMTGYGNLQITPSQGTCQVTAAPAVSCALGTLAAGASARLTLTGEPGAPSASTTVSAQALGAEADPVASNNRASATFSVTNTPAGTNVTVPLTTSTGAASPVTVTFSSTTGGQTVADPIAAPPPVPSGFQIASMTYDITTTATYTPPVTVCIDGSFGAADYLLHFEGGAWVQLPNQQRLPVGGPPFTRVCADTATFSPFVVATRANRAPTVEAGPNQVVEATSVTGAAATVAATATDPDGDALTYTWSGACGIASGVSATLTCPIGTNVVTLSVSDGQSPAVTDTLTVTVRDTTAPTITIASPGSNASYTVGQAVTAQFTCTDGGSGVQSCEGTLAVGASVPTDTPGTFTFTVDAVDAVGNPARVSVTYTVRARTFAFEGFFWPVQNPPIVNKVKAGSAIPVRFSLGGNHGLDIFAPGFPQVVQVACGTGLPEGEVQETVTAGKSGLIYNPLTKRYIYVWKTQKEMAGACWQLTLQFTDGTSASALFKMRR